MRLFPELPLLKRELTELANRKRTYVVRFVGALVILFYVFLVYQQAMNSRLASPFQTSLNPMFGVGGQIFSRITPSLFVAIQILMPALCCASIAHEKESNTLGTLLLTRLSPWTIVLEKFLSRIVPMLTLLLVSFPVLAHVFSLGGVDTVNLCCTIWLLLCECLLFGSFALLCSAWYPTTLSAFTAAYVGTAILAILILSLDVGLHSPLGMWFRLSYSVPEFLNIEDAKWLELSQSNRGALFLLVSTRLLIRSLPVILVIATFLLLTRMLLIWRASVSQSSALLRFFKMVDRFFQWLNHRTTGGIELISDSGNFPIDDPIAWRERSKKSLGKARYLFRILVALQVPTLFICATAAITSAYRSFEGLTVLLCILWALAALIVCIKASTLMTSERSRQTLESLLACPLTAQEIMIQKIAGTNRLMIVMAVPVLTVHLTLFLVLFNGSVASLLYPILASLNTLLLLKIIIWMSAGIGLKFSSQIKAVLAASLATLVWIAGPSLLYIMVSIFLRIEVPQIQLLSPVAAVICNEISLISSVTQRSASWFFDVDMPLFIVAIVLTSVNAVMLFLLKHYIKSRLPRLLGRQESPEGAARVDSSENMEGPA